MRRVFAIPRLVALTLFVFVASGYSIGSLTMSGTATAVGDVTTGWQLGTSFYPAATRLVTSENGSNAEMQRLFGAVHDSSYGTLGRIDGKGWVQSGKLTKTTRRNHKRVKVTLVWTYGVSYYPDDGQAAHARADLNVRLNPLAGDTPSMSMARFSRNGRANTLVLLDAANLTVEMLCTVNKGERQKFGQMVDQYCAMQRTALAHILSVATAPTPTATPTATSVPTATKVPTVPVATLTPTATTAPTRTPTPGIIFIPPPSRATATSVIMRSTATPVIMRPTPTSTPPCPGCTP